MVKLSEVPPYLIRRELFQRQNTERYTVLKEATNEQLLAELKKTDDKLITLKNFMKKIRSYFDLNKRAKNARKGKDA